MTVSAPRILTGPDSVTNVTGDNVVLMCEATGFPIPHIGWLFQRTNDETSSLPGNCYLTGFSTLSSKLAGDDWKVESFELLIIDHLSDILSILFELSSGYHKSAFLTPHCPSSVCKLFFCIHFYYFSRTTWLSTVNLGTTHTFGKESKFVQMKDM
jgi:hypothetical protein